MHLVNHALGYKCGNDSTYELYAHSDPSWMHVTIVCGLSPKRAEARGKRHVYVWLNIVVEIVFVFVVLE